MAEASWQDRVDVITWHGYKRYDERTSTMLGNTSELLIGKYNGDLRKLRDEAKRDVKREHQLLQQFSGIGPVGADIFLREVQPVWDETYPYAGAPPEARYERPSAFEARAAQGLYALRGGAHANRTGKGLRRNPKDRRVMCHPIQPARAKSSLFLPRSLQFSRDEIEQTENPIQSRGREMLKSKKGSKQRLTDPCLILGRGRATATNQKW